jgi:hypothetical protein
VKPLGALPWITLALILAHVAEELPRFPEWATRHFGTTTTAFFVVSHIPLLAATFYIARRAASPEASARWLLAAVMVQTGMGANGLFHLATTWTFGEYSPGVVTGAGFHVPFAVYLIHRARLDPRLRPAGIAAACGAGVALAGLLTASLWLDISFI